MPIVLLSRLPILVVVLAHQGLITVKAEYGISVSITAHLSSSYTAGSLLGLHGDGTFRAMQDFATGARPRSVAVADFNGDAWQDLAVANESSDTLSVLLGKGDGTFQPKRDYATGARPRSVAVLDLDGDGKLDLAVANENSETLGVLLGNGDGTFQATRDFGTGSN